jgi:hypothetical protein
MLLQGLNLLQEKIQKHIPNPPDPLDNAASRDLGSED